MSNKRKVNKAMKATKVQIYGTGTRYVAESEEAINETYADDILAGNTLIRSTYDLDEKFKLAEEVLDKQLAIFSNKLDILLNKEMQIQTSSKEVSGKIRDSAQKLSDGLTRLEKLANFDKLERIVVQLERAEAALSSLAQLEQSGKLDKIINAFK